MLEVVTFSTGSVLWRDIRSSLSLTISCGTVVASITGNWQQPANYGHMYRNKERFISFETPALIRSVSSKSQMGRPGPKSAVMFLLNPYHRRACIK